MLYPANQTSNLETPYFLCFFLFFSKAKLVGKHFLVTFWPSFCKLSQLICQIPVHKNQNVFIKAYLLLGLAEFWRLCRSSSSLLSLGGSRDLSKSRS